MNRGGVGFFFSSRRRHTRCLSHWSSDVCSSDLALLQVTEVAAVDAGAVTIRLLDTNAVHAEGLERQREALSQLVTRYLTGPVRIKLEGAEGGGSREQI